MKAEERDWAKNQAHIKEYVDEYEMIGKDDQGRDGCHTSTDGERALIEDATHGLVGESDFDALYHQQPAHSEPVGTLINEGTKATAPQPAEPVKVPSVLVHQFRTSNCSDWYDGHPDYSDGGGPYETRTLYTTPPADGQAPQDADPTPKEQYRRIFNAACSALGLINEKLGPDPDDHGAAQR